MELDLKTIIGPKAAKKSSAELTADRERVAAELAATEARLGELQKKRPAILKSFDDAAAESHDREIGVAQRQVDRLIVVLDELEKLIGKAQIREEGNRLDKLEADTKAAVQDVLKDLREVYAPAAKQIAGFLEKWRRVQEMAMRNSKELFAAGRPYPGTPEGSARIEPQKVIPEREETETVDGGYEYEYDDQGLVVRTKHRGLRTITRRIPEERISGRCLPPLADTVVLPPPRFDDAPIWPPRR
ncbi:hypothetical protein [Azospirillum sp.]|uniref:hypothetical protein n=1 Tax=Azospirillum sp. TaxID=34012 RepID=UPI002D4B659A|nr:hypothetical protein [Azospirillum sp.]HYD65727.1 hypothetical protein [Azospirillum sp.]